MNDCVFCNIVNRSVPAEVLFENERVIAVKDILPQAPVHIQIFPKQHIVSLNACSEAQQALIGEMILTGKHLAEKNSVAPSGYRIMLNVGADGGQVVGHMHMHLLGGKKMS